MYSESLKNFLKQEKNEMEKIKKENNKLAFKKLESQLDILLYGQEINREELKNLWKNNNV